jgi:very-short-patch-repair endonuclease
MKEINKLFLEDNSHYPYVSLPNLVVTYLQGNTPCLDLLPLPTLQLEKVDYKGYMIVLGIFIISGFLVFFKVKSLIIYGIIAFLIWFFVNNIRNPYQETKRNNKERIINYNQEVDRITKINNDIIIIKNSLRNTENAKNYSQKKIYEILKTSISPLLSYSMTKKGASEFFFLSTLIRYFGDKIKVNYQFSDYTPDFVILCEGIYINIEIDEPYTSVGETKIPIHCSDDAKNGERDDSFTSSNWCVIRFAEEQVLLEPAECCKFITDIIGVLIKVNIDTLKILTEKKYPQRIKRWDRTEALQFAKYKKRRAVYLQAEGLALKSEYHFSSSFKGDSFTFITKLSDWNNDVCLCVDFNNSDNLILLEKSLFPSFEIGDTIKINLKSYLNRYEWVQDCYYNDVKNKFIIISKNNVNIEQEIYINYDNPLANSFYNPMEYTTSGPNW